MIRRAFLRRMASAAMAGMLGLELVSRAPKMTLVSDPDVIRKYTDMAIDTLYNGTLTITAVDYKARTITVENMPATASMKDDYVFRATP